MQSEYRKHQHTMLIYGTGVILFGVWSIVKGIVYFLITDPVVEMIRTTGDFKGAAEKWFAIIFIVCAVCVFLGLDLLFRWKAGMMARAIGEDKTKVGILFYVWTGYVALIDVAEIALGIADLVRADGDPVDTVITLMVDLTSLVTVIEMLIAAHMIRTLKREMEKEQAGTLQTG